MGFSVVFYLFSGTVEHLKTDSLVNDRVLFKLINVSLLFFKVVNVFSSKIKRLHLKVGRIRVAKKI